MASRTTPSKRAVSQLNTTTKREHSTQQITPNAPNVQPTTSPSKRADKNKKQVIQLTV
jgi:hypothetical protein